MNGESDGYEPYYFSVGAALAISAIETNSDFSLWEWTVEWSYQQLRDLGNWLIDLVS